MEEGSREGVTKLRIPRKVGNLNTVSFPVTVLHECAVSCRWIAYNKYRWIACNKYRNNGASPLFLFATQNKTSLCLSSKRESGTGQCIDQATVRTIRGSNPGQDKIPDSCPKRPYRLWGPPSFRFSGDRCSIPGVKGQGFTKSTTHHRQVLWLRMSGSILSLTHTSLWRVPGQRFVD